MTRSEELVARYRVDREPLSDRPYISSVMIASIDGAIDIEGTSRKLGNETDTALLLMMRQQSDAVLVGARTASLEQYKPSRMEQLRMVIASRNPQEDWDRPLWQSDRTILLTTTNAINVPGHVDALRCGKDTIDLALAMRELRARGIRRIACEGGPRLNGAMLDADLFDESCLTIAPFMVGGNSARVVQGGSETQRTFRLAHALSHEDCLYIRYVRAD
jgi:riboflavin biosynthesis pyrimidine reductase